MIRELAKKILQRAEAYEWTLQGFGMLRLYLGTVGRLHVWDDRYAVPGVSVIHDHAWDLASTVLSGELTNIVYQVQAPGIDCGALYSCQTLLTGEGGGLIGNPVPVRLERVEFGLYGPKRVRQHYAQVACEVHETRAVRGTVTLVERAEGEGQKTARSFWPVGEMWISAEPRPATVAEVRDICENALQGFTG